MRMKVRNIALAASALALAPKVLLAAETVPAKTGSDGASGQTTLMMLAGLSIILLLVIGILSGAMRGFSETLVQQYRQQKDKLAGKAAVLVLLLMSVSMSAFADGAVKAQAAKPMISGVSDTESYLMIIFISLELLVIFGLLYNIASLKKKIDENGGKMSLPAEYVAQQAKKSWFWDNFNAAASLEREKDVLLDHNYDGIQELDNSLPPWWKYGFYITIVAGAIYFFRYQVIHSAPNSKEEYEAEMAQGEADKVAYLAKAGNSVDETTVTLLTDPESLAAGKEIFTKNCTPCHLADGGGLVGPNLTDDYWLHGGGIKDVFKTIKYGYQEKGMKSWKDDFSPKQIQQVASYVKSLHGTKPANPKAPQGDLYVEATAK